MRLLLISLATIVSLVLSGCINSPALPLGAGVYIGDPGERPEEELVGVVNGVWKYDPARARSLMEQYDSHLSEAEIATYSQRYMVRVGIKKMSTAEALMLVVPGSKWAEYAVLPDGWSHDAQTISNDPHVINVGDLVKLRVQRGRLFDFVIDSVRKCGAMPDPGEKKYWQIGCKTYAQFEPAAYAGEHYYWMPF